MPVAVSYPGVYIEEVPSGVHTITGVATSITAFIGRARRGPVNEPTTVNSFADFERVFGGLWQESRLGFAVRDFFLNGGGQAVIVRLFNPTLSAEDQPKAAATAVANKAKTEAGTDLDAALNDAKSGKIKDQAKKKAEEFNDKTDAEKQAAQAVLAAIESVAKEGAKVGDVIKVIDDAVSKAAPITKAQLKVGTENVLTLEAANEGAWGNALRARIDYDVKEGAADLFNLSIRDGLTERVEVFRNVSIVSGHIRQIDNVLRNESQLVRVSGFLPADRPSSHPDKAQNENDVWVDNSTATNTKVADTDKASDGGHLGINNFTGSGKEDKKEGLYALKKADLFNILCIPPYLSGGDVDNSLVSIAARYCEQRRAMFLIDPPTSWTNKDAAKSGVASIGTSSKNAALFFPRLKQPNPERDNQMEDFVPCGAVAGVFARTDTQRGIWKAPAGLEATLVGVPQLSVALNDAENGELNPLGINCLRTMPAAGRIIWGARTLQGDDRLASEWKYIPVRRTALFIEESLYRGTQWAVFEPNDEPLWAQLRLNIGAFMNNLFRQGAFQGQTAREAYLVKCDGETTTQNDINLGIVNVVVGFAPLKPAEFVIIKIQQLAGQIQV